MMQIQIYPMAPQHVQAVAQLEQLCFADPWSQNSIASELTNPLSVWLVAQCEQTLVGYVGSQSVLGEADMMNLAVHPQVRRQGVAAALLQALQASLKDRGVTSLSLDVRESNEPALALYRGHGFVQVGCRPNYYRNPKENALILKKQWSADV